MTTGPYATAAAGYYAAGWHGVLPIRGKWPPPSGYTGAEGVWPSGADVMAWADGDEGARNVGLRVPPHVIGIDVDAYDDKAGAATIAQAVARFGALPPTWSTTSRDDGASGIRLYAVTPGLRWPGVVGPGVEVIQYRHRYAMAWPSIHPSGAVYRWRSPLGDPVDAYPSPDDLPNLPDAWVAGLTRGEAEQDIARADLTDVDVVEWLRTVGGGDAEHPCPAIDRATQRAMLEIAANGSRHDAAVRATARIAHLTADGHPGGATALAAIGRAFTAALGPEAAKRAGEWGRMVTGAVRIAAAQPARTGGRVDPCTFGGSGAFGTGTDARTVTAAPTSTQTPAGTPAGTTTATTPTGNDTGALAVVHDITPRADPDPAPVPDPAPMEAAVAYELALLRARRAAKRLLDAEEGAASFLAPPFRATLIEELTMPDEPITYAVDQLCPTGGNVLLTAQFKAGKTTLLANLARAYADGVPFLDRFAVAPLDGRRVGIFNYELDERQMRRWLRDIGFKHPENVCVLNLRGYRMPVAVPMVEDWVVGWLRDHNVGVWIPDPFARVASGSVESENDNAQVGAFLETLDVIKDRAGVSEMFLPTHTGRTEFDEGAERARGATRLDDWADVRWLLVRGGEAHASERYLRATGRDVETDEMQLQFDPATRHLSISGGNRRDARLMQYVIRIVDFVRDNPGVSGRTITAGTGIGKTIGPKAMEQAVADGLIVNRGTRSKAEWHVSDGTITDAFS